MWCCIAALAVDPQQSDTVYVGGRFAYNDPGSPVLFKSTDGGASWIPASSGLPGGLGALAIDAQNSSTRRLQFRTPCRHIHCESLSANGHDQPVSCDEKWIFFFHTQRDGSFLHVTHLTSGAEHLSWRASRSGVVQTIRLATFLGTGYVRGGNNLRKDRGPSPDLPWRKRPINATPDDREGQLVAWFRR